MKPDWKGAPEWAQWLAQDEDGSWYWYAQEPVMSANDGYWRNRETSQFLRAQEPDLNAWKETLEKRPT